MLNTYTYIYTQIYIHYINSMYIMLTLNMSFHISYLVTVICIDLCLLRVSVISY